MTNTNKQLTLSQVVDASRARGGVPTQEAIFRAFSYGSICGEVADHFNITIKEARKYLRAFKAQR